MSLDPSAYLSGCSGKTFLRFGLVQPSSVSGGGGGGQHYFLLAREDTTKHVRSSTEFLFQFS